MGVEELAQLTAGVIWGGTGAQTVDTENWNGTSWSCIRTYGYMEDIIVLHWEYRQQQYPQQDIQTRLHLLINQKSYNGSTWTTGNDVQTARQGAAGAGVNNSCSNIWW